MDTRGTIAYIIATIFIFSRTHTKILSFYSLNSEEKRFLKKDVNLHNILLNLISNPLNQKRVKL